MDETDAAQTPAELLIILAAIADEGIPIQTIAPKFTGRFNKGVDYVGNVDQFRREIVLDVAAIAWATANLGLPKNLKLSVHSGSDKFSIYAAIYEATKKSGRASEDRGHDLAGGDYRAGRSGRRRARAGEGDLRRRRTTIAKSFAGRTRR